MTSRISAEKLISSLYTMRYITFFVLFFVSTMSFAAGIQKSSDAALSKTIQKDVKTLVQQGRKEVQ